MRRTDSEPHAHGTQPLQPAFEQCRRIVMVAAMVIFSIALIQAQRTRPDNDGQGIPVATNRILESPDAYDGKLVTLSAGVDQVLTGTAFVVDQQGKVAGGTIGPIGKPLLVLAPYLKHPVEPKAYLTVRGEVVKLNAAAVGRLAPDYHIDLAPSQLTKFEGQPVMVANSVIDSTRAELGKKPLPPPSADELALSVTMKRIAPAFTALQAASKEAKAADVVENSRTLQPAFEQTEAIWNDLGQVAAAEWARAAQDSVRTIERDAGSGNWDGVRTAAGALNRVCQNCHGAYRDRVEDGTFRIRAGSF